MRELARGGYSANQVRGQLAADTAVVSQRFDLVDRAYRVVDRLDVRSATVDWVGSRPIPRSLTMEMLPRPDLLDVPFQYLVKPYWMLKMDNVDGGYAEWPMGAYVFTIPERTVIENAAAASGLSDDLNADDRSVNPETWRMVLSDQTHYLDAAGVGPQGFTLPTGARFTEGIAGALARNNLADISGVASSEAVTASQLTWTLRSGAQATTTTGRWEYVFVPGPYYLGTHRNLMGRLYARYEWRYFESSTSSALKDQATSWLAVLAQLHQSLGYSPPGFDLDQDRYVARPAVDYSALTGAPVIVYEAADDGLLLPDVTIAPNLRELGNRATVTQSNPAGVNDVAVADLNDLIPGHPLSQGVTGVYMELAATSPGGSSYPQLVAQAKDLLFTSVRSFETIRFTTLPNPAHEAWEILSLRLPNDPGYDVPQLCAEAAWSFDLFGGVMTHEARRLFVPAAIQ